MKTTKKWMNFLIKKQNKTVSYFLTVSWWENKKSAETKNQVMGEPERWANAKDGFHEEAPADTSNPSTHADGWVRRGPGTRAGVRAAQDRGRQETPDRKAKQETTPHHKRSWQRNLSGAEETTSIFPTVIATSSPPSKPVTRIHTQTKLGRKRNSTRSWADGAHNQQPVKLQTHFRRQIQATHKEFPQVQLPRDWVHRQKSHIYTKAGKQNTTYKNQWKHRQKN